MSTKEEVQIEETKEVVQKLKAKKTQSDIKEEIASYILDAVTPAPKLHPAHGKLRY
tara:strand:- start:1590 stop:1757 length:168 start_codon:yes stop_codon:yes gene_type:complete